MGTATAAPNSNSGRPYVRTFGRPFSLSIFKLTHYLGGISFVYYRILKEQEKINRFIKIRDDNIQNPPQWMKYYWKIFGVDYTGKI